MSRLGWFGVVVTICYVVAFWCLFQPQISQLDSLKPNELGDFLAGVFGPVALFWVVLGFFQQGAELKNSVETLKLQATELKNSVEQQRELVKASREQIELDRETILYQREQLLREIMPIFVVTPNGGHSTGNGHMFRVDILNKGEIASDIEIQVTPKIFSPDRISFPSISRGCKESIELTRVNEQMGTDKCEMQITCSKRDGSSFEERYWISYIESDSFPTTRKIEITKAEFD